MLATDLLDVPELLRFLREAAEELKAAARRADVAEARAAGLEKRLQELDACARLAAECAGSAKEALSLSIRRSADADARAEQALHSATNADLRCVSLEERAMTAEGAL